MISNTPDVTQLLEQRVGIELQRERELLHLRLARTRDEPDEKRMPR